MAASAPPAAHAPWPAQFATPQQVLAWLDSLTPQPGLTAPCLLAMRWLVLAELDRPAPAHSPAPEPPRRE